MFRFLTAIVFLLSSMTVAGQSPDLFRIFYFNPYVFNAAYCGNSDYTEIELIHRQQWMNFNNGPAASGFVFQYPTQKRLSLGLNFFIQEAVALRTSSIMASFAYRVPLSANQFLNFGVSLGGGLNKLDLEDSDYSNDPTILQAAGNSWYADGNFGILYTLNKLKIGIALTQLFGHSYFRRSTLNDIRFSQLKNQLYSLQYKFSLGSNVEAEPGFLYHLRRDNQNSWELFTVFHFYKKITFGGSYHNTQGPALLFGATIKQKVCFSYNYEFTPVSDDFASVSSHEFHLSVRLGKQKRIDEKM
jgi:type IX secretion system PorP/SprF family membrane protein